MKTKKQQELLNSFLDTLDHELGLLYQEIAMCLSELGYYPRKQRSYLVFKHDLHNKEMAKMGLTWTKDHSPYFALRFSACKGYSEKFSNIVRDYIEKNTGKLFPHCEEGNCIFRSDGVRPPRYEYSFSNGENGFCCGAKALVIPNIIAEDIYEIKIRIREEHDYLIKHEA